MRPVLGQRHDGRGRKTAPKRVHRDRPQPVLSCKSKAADRVGQIKTVAGKCGGKAPKTAGKCGRGEFETTAGGGMI